MCKNCNFITSILLLLIFIILLHILLFLTKCLHTRSHIKSPCHSNENKTYYFYFYGCYNYYHILHLENHIYFIKEINYEIHGVNMENVHTLF